MTKRDLTPTTALVPTPVVLVTCRDREGRDNIITLAWVGVVNSAPPMFGISIRPSRYSYGIIVDRGEFGFNIPSRPQLQQVDFCGAVSGRKENKFQRTGFTPLPGKIIDAPLIQECPINVECRVQERIPLGSHDLFLGKVLAVRASESVMKGDRLDVAEVAPLAYTPVSHEYWSLGEVVGKYGHARSAPAD